MAFFFNDTATTETYTLSQHDALPICQEHAEERQGPRRGQKQGEDGARDAPRLLLSPLVQQLGVHGDERSEEHTSELQSRQYLVCRLLLEKKKMHFAQHIKVVEQ